MKNPIAGRNTLLSRMSSVDGSIHLNRGMRDVYDAQKRAQKSFDTLRQNAEQARKRVENLRKLTRQVEHVSVEGR